jgi:hypothetical protein
MKKLNFTHFTPILLLTLLVTGCLPDSLTKWKKDPPQKPVAASTLVPVVDSTGKKLTFTPPTYFTYTQGAITTFNLQINVESTSTTASYDGSLKDKTNGPKFIISCGLDLTGDAQTQSLPAGLSIDTMTCNITGTPTANTSIAAGKEFCSDSTITTQDDCIVTPFTWDASSQSCSNKDLKYQNQTDCEAGLNTWYSKGDAIPYRIKFSYKDADGYPHDMYTTVPIGVYSKMAAVRYTFADKLLLGVQPIDKDTYNSAVPVKTSVSSTPYIPANMISALNGVQGVINYINQTNNYIGVHSLIKMTLSKPLTTTFKAGDFVKANTTSASGRDVVGKIYKTDSSNSSVIYVENISDNEAYFSIGDVIKYHTYSGGWSAELDSATIRSIDDTYYFSKTSTPDLDNDEQYYGSKYSLKNPAVNSYTVGKPIKPLKAILDITPDPSIVYSVSPKLPDGLSLNTSTGTITGTFSKSTAPTTYTVTATNPISSVNNSVRLISSDAPSDLSISNRQVITVSNTINFTEGETLRQPIVAPATTSNYATILKILNGYQMAIEVHNGKFSEKASLDSGATYLAEKAYIIPNNSCVNTAYKTKTDCETNSYVWSTGDIFYSVSVKAKYTGTGTPAAFNIGECRKINSEGVDLGASVDNTKVDCDANSKEGSLQIWSPTRIINTATASNLSTYGIITQAIKVDANNYNLFISHNTGTVSGLSDAKKFNAGDIFYKLNASTGAYGTTDFTIQSIESNSLILTLPALTGFSTGGEVTLKGTGYPDGKAGGYIYNVDSSGSHRDVYISDVSYAPQKCSDPSKTTKSSCLAAVGTWYEPIFSANVAGDELYNSDTVGGATSPLQTITNVSHDILIIGERGKDLYFNATNSSSGATTYTVSPDLPSGLKLNSSTGEVTGTPTVAMPRREFTLKATNFVDQASFVFAMEVRDYFELANDSTAQSFIMHKTGSTRFNRGCRVNSTDIYNASGDLDIRCYLDGEEEDVYSNNIKLKVTSGPGLCEYVEYAPYFFYTNSPIKTTGKSFTVVSGCEPATGYPPGFLTKKPTAGEVCKGNHTGATCDEGSFSVTTVNYTKNPQTSVCEESSSTTETVTCDGQEVNCIAGPLKDLITETLIQQGIYSKLYQTTTDPYSKTFDIVNTPSLNYDYTNLRVANENAANRCSFSNLNHTETWLNSVAGTYSTASPFGGANPYYTFHCLDAAHEIKARIRLVLREWDKSFKINDSIDNEHNSTVTSYPTFYSNDAAATLTSTKKDSHAVDTTNFRPYNYFNDWDDDYSSGGVCSITNYTDEYNCLKYKGVWTPSVCIDWKATSKSDCTLSATQADLGSAFVDSTKTIAAAAATDKVYTIYKATWQTDGANLNRCYVSLATADYSNRNPDATKIDGVDYNSISAKYKPYLFSEACGRIKGNHVGIASFKHSGNDLSTPSIAKEELSCRSTCTNPTYSGSGSAADAINCVNNSASWVPYYCLDLSTGTIDATKNEAACASFTGAGTPTKYRWTGVTPGCSDGKGANQDACGICDGNSSATSKTECGKCWYTTSTTTNNDPAFVLNATSDTYVRGFTTKKACINATQPTNGATPPASVGSYQWQDLSATWKTGGQVDSNGTVSPTWTPGAAYAYPGDNL